MTPGSRRVWRTTDKWRNVAYLYFGDSSGWRFLLEENPSYDIRYVPAPGTVINIETKPVQGKVSPGGPRNPGLLAQPDTNLDLRGPRSITQPESGQPGIFPWDNATAYANRLGEYTALALLTPDRTNGFGLDSPQADADTQRG